MAETITFRPDADARRALAVLTQDDTPVSTADRTALTEAAKTAAQDKLRAEAVAMTPMVPRRLRSSETWRRCVRGEVYRLRPKWRPRS